MKIEEIIDSLKKFTLVELNDLVKAIEKEFNVSATMTVAASAETKNEEPTEVNVVLTSTGMSKIPVIKLVGKLTGKGLMDSKALIDKLPVVLKEKIKVEEAEEIKKEFVAAGATIEFK